MGSGVTGVRDCTGIAAEEELTRFSGTGMDARVLDDDDGIGQRDGREDWTSDKNGSEGDVTRVDKDKDRGSR
jgi:hypothetical protein